VVLAVRSDLAHVSLGGGQLNPLIVAAGDGQALCQVLGLRPDLFSLEICAINSPVGIKACHRDETGAARKIRPG
jgi:hypothetical protein